MVRDSWRSPRRRRLRSARATAPHRATASRRSPRWQTAPPIRPLASASCAHEAWPAWLVWPTWANRSWHGATWLDCSTLDAVKWTPGTENEDVVDQRGSRIGAAQLTGGGLAAAVVVVLVARVFGVDVSGLLGGGGGGAPSSAPRTDRQQPPTGPDPDKPLVDFVKFVMKDVQDTFETKFRAAGQPYRRAKLVLFTEAVDTGCGRSSAAIGPFYCSADEHAYIDLSFYRELRQRFGAPGDFAQAYVLAHEIGHHLQKLLGVEQRAQTLGRGHNRNDVSVRTELQADCFAGVWGH